MYGNSFNYALFRFEVLSAQISTTPDEMDNSKHGCNDGDLYSGGTWFDLW